MDAGLAACILVVPFLMGGRHPVGQLALVTLTSIVVLAWALRQATGGHGVWRSTYASWILLFGVILVALQLVPLSHGSLARLCPHTVNLLPLWTPQADPMTRLGIWNCISLTPADTRAGLILFVSYSLLFLVTVQRVHRVEDVERILRWCAVAAILMAGFGLVQSFANNGKFFWFYEAPYSSTSRLVKGSFTNRNHFAHFLALGIGPLVWWLHSMYRTADKDDRRRRAARAGRSTSETTARYLLILAVALVVFAGLLSLSRGGNSVIFLAATIAAVACGRALAVRGRFLLGMAAIGLLIVTALSSNVLDLEKASQRLSDLTSGSLERLDASAGRRTLWASIARAVPDFGLFGSGVGSHREVCPVYLERPIDGVFFSHAENGPLQEALETGYAGAVLLVCGIGFCAFWCVRGLCGVRSSRWQACLGAIAASLAASLAHSLVDFVWYVPACMAMVAILAGLACRGWQLSRPPARTIGARRLSPVAALAVAAIVLVVSIGMIENRARATIAQHYWDRSLIAARKASRRIEKQRDVGEPVDRQCEIDTERQLIADLEQVVRWYPEHARAHLSLARSHLHLFDLLQAVSVNPMPLAQVRDAVIDSQAGFASRRARDDWMRRALGEHCEHLHLALEHTRRGLEGCPLQGEGYLYLAELCFLDEATPNSKWDYLNQAMRVRPFDGKVWRMATWETLQALLAGDVRPWLTFARRAIRSGTRWQKQQILEAPVAHTPPEGLESMIELLVTQLDPDLEGLSFLYEASKKRGRPEQLKQLQVHYVGKAESEARAADGREAARLWMLAAQVHDDMGNHRELLRCTRSACECNPSDLKVRYRLACLLLKEGDGAEAGSHLKWCLRREPDNKAFQRKYQEALGRSHGRQASRRPKPTR